MADTGADTDRDTDRTTDRATDRETDPGRRGRLVIHDRVVEKIATTAAGEVDGVTPSGSGLDGVVGRRYPKADARTAGSRTRVAVEVAVSWPAPLAEVLPQVRDRVRERLRSLAGLETDTVDVVAAKIVHDDAPPPRRVT